MIRTQEKCVSFDVFMIEIRKTTLFWDACLEMVSTFRANLTEEPNGIQIIKIRICVIHLWPQCTSSNHLHMAVLTLFEDDISLLCYQLHTYSVHCHTQPYNTSLR